MIAFDKIKQVIADAEVDAIKVEDKKNRAAATRFRGQMQLLVQLVKDARAEAFDVVKG